ncbi:molybdopterin-binding protein [Aquimarina sp. AU474]|uniref:TOBE domain-containing protein n=1 Tax=Aquimarina sp. AU474 TaxID=2108529 RepID=UPI000D68A734|nr:TOBE domain-containing protein [Aquimarina sp. AU474]
MNTLEGKIASIKTNGSLSLVTINVNDILFQAMIIETPDTVSYLKKTNPVKVVFKETEVIISKGDGCELSIPNKVTGNISTIEKGVLLSKIIISTAVGDISAIITSDAMNEMILQIEEEVTILIKTTEIMLSQ